jgi:hypothetical protein
MTGDSVVKLLRAGSKLSIQTSSSKGPRFSPVKLGKWVEFTSALGHNDDFISLSYCHAASRDVS